MMRQLLNVVHQTEQMPLCVHLGLSAQREAIQLLVVTQVAKHRLYRGHPLPIAFASLWAINRLFHALGVGQRRGLLLIKECYLPCGGSIGVP